MKRSFFLLRETNFRIFVYDGKKSPEEKMEIEEIKNSFERE